VIVNQSNMLRLVAAAALCGVAATAQADEVNLSRYRVKAVMPPAAADTQVGQNVAATQIAALCEDGDGCTVRIQIVGALGGLRAAEWVIFKSGTTWTFAGETFTFVDGDLDSSDTSLDFGIEGDLCLFTDGNANGVDDAPGFAVIAFHYAGGGSTFGFTCTLTLID
jgi:hypothetical protein